MKKLIKLCWKENLVVLGLIVATSMSQVMASLMNVAILNSLIQLGRQGFLFAVGKMIGWYGSFLFFTYWQIRGISCGKQRMILQLRKETARGIASQDYQAFHQKSTSTYLSYLVNDVTMIETQAFDNFYQILSGVVVASLSLVALWKFHWLLLAGTLLLSGLLLLLPKIFEKPMRQVSQNVAIANEELVNETTDCLKGYDTLFHLQLRSRISEKILAASQSVLEEKNQQVKVMSKVAIVGGIGNVAGQMGILALTGYLALIGSLSVGSITATGNLAGNIFNLLGNITQQIAAIQGTEPLFKKLAQQQQVEDEGVSQPLALKATNLSLKEVAFAYEEQPIITNFDYQFEAGKKYALVGKSGSGKTTLLNLLNGKLREYQGSIQLGSYEMKELSLGQITEEILYVEQTPYIFTGTWEENLTLGEEFPQGALEEVLATTDLLPEVEALPKGLATSVGENGRLLSGGQKQRLALARGLLREKSVLLVDECTANLDAKSALAVEKALLSQSEQTVIMISHHLKPEIEEQLDAVVSL